MRQHTYFEAYLDDFDKIIVFMSKDSYGGISNRFYLKDRFGHMQELSINSIEQTGNNYNKYTLMIHGEMQIGHEYYVVHQFAREAVLEYAYITKTQRFDELYAYEGNDLGANYTKQKTTFVLWAPCASRIKLELIKHGQRVIGKMRLMLISCVSMENGENQSILMVSHPKSMRFALLWLILKKSK